MFNARHRIRFVCLVASLVIAGGLATRGEATTYVLTFGGGPNPTLDQLSLESNVSYFRTVLAKLGHADWRHDLYFADGGAGERTVQYLCPRDDDMRFRERLANIFTPEQANNVELTTAYRRTEIANVQGTADGKNLAAWIASTGRSLGAGDRLLFYFTGHGSPDATGARPARNTVMDMWNSPAVPVREFAADLDQLDPSADVLLVMVQCFSGGFANVIYNGGDPSRGLSRQVRLGYFSTVSVRTAAGCTSDIQGDDYREFSTAFFAALCGVKRGGKPIAKPDYDGDGVTTLAEAFSAVLVESDTIDIPMTTIDLLLRDKSRFGPSRAAAATAPAAEGPATVDATTGVAASTPRSTADPDAARVAGLLPLDLGFAEVHALASPAECGALDGLARSLDLSGTDPLAQARDLVRSIEADRKKLGEERQRLVKAYGIAKFNVRKRLTLRWPELSNPWLPESVKLVETQRPAIREALEAMPEYTAYVEASDRVDKVVAQDRALERRWARTHRLLERAVTIVLAANLPKVADAATLNYYRELRKRENSSL